MPGGGAWACKGGAPRERNSRKKAFTGTPLASFRSHFKREAILRVIFCALRLNPCPVGAIEFPVIVYETLRALYCERAKPSALPAPSIFDASCVRAGPCR